MFIMQKLLPAFHATGSLCSPISAKTKSSNTNRIVWFALNSIGFHLFFGAICFLLMTGDAFSQEINLKVSDAEDVSAQIFPLAKFASIDRGKTYDLPSTMDDGLIPVQPLKNTFNGIQSTSSNSAENLNLSLRGPNHICGEEVWIDLYVDEGFTGEVSSMGVSLLWDKSELEFVSAEGTSFGNYTPLIQYQSPSCAYLKYFLFTFNNGIKFPIEGVRLMRTKFRVLGNSGGDSIDIRISNLLPCCTCNTWAYTVISNEIPIIATNWAAALDTEAPLLENCPENVTTTTSFDGGYDCWTSEIWTPPTAYDNCDGPIIPTADHSFIFGLGTTVVTFSATDAAENTGTCSFSVTVSDDQAPYFNDCPANISTTTSADGPGDCTATVTWSPPTTWDNCYEDLLTPTSNHHPGEFFGLGTTTVTYHISDPYSNSANPCSFTVSVTDDEAPNINCPGTVTVNCSGNVPPVNLGAVSASDCSSVIKSHVGDATTTQTCTNRKTITRTYRATDDSNNSATCSQVITVEDTTMPTFTSVPANVTVQCNNLPAVGAPAASDNCGGTVSITYNGQTTTGTCTLTRRWTATDACGNTRTATQRISVVDIQKPNFINLPNNITVQCDAIPGPATPAATDLCDPVVAVTYNGETKITGACPNAYTLTRRWTAADDCNNTRSISQRITVVDNVKPVLTVPANTTIACNENPPPVGTPTASDGCSGAVTITYLGQTTGNSQCPGTFDILRLWRATDVCGNINVATQTIHVQDTTAPVFTSSPADITIQCNQIPPAPGTPTASDACGGYVFITYLGQAASGSGCANSYTITRTWRAQDMCGLTTTTEQVITVQGNNYVPEGAENREKGVTKFIASPFSILVNPNPTTDRISIDLSGFAGETITFSIFNEMGQLVWQRKLNARDESVISASLREAGASAGIYTLSVCYAKTVVTKRIVLVD